MKHSYENFLKRLIDRETIPVNEDQWSKMQVLLEREGLIQPESSQTLWSRMPWKSFSLAAVTLMVGVVIGMTLNTNKINSTENMAVNLSSQENTATPNTAAPANTSYATYSKPKVVYMPSPNMALTKYIFLSEKNVEKVEPTEPISRQRFSYESISPSIAYSPSNSSDIPSIKYYEVPGSKAENLNIANERDRYNRELLEQIRNEKARLANVSNFSETEHVMNYGLKGGVFAGLGQGGYSGTLHLEGRITDKIMFESDMGVMNSLGSMGNIMPAVSSKTDATHDGIPVNTAQGIGYSSIEPGSRVVSNENVDYLFSVFNPSAGYKIHKRVTLKMGIDFQTNLSNNTEKTYIRIQDRYFRMAKYDLGLTPKINVQIAPKISGELIYRNGINASLMGSEYWNRNYFFAQLSLNIR